MAWANLDLDPDLPNHPKLIALEADIGNTALSHIIRLWCWVYSYAPDGNIWRFRNPDFLERQVMGWAGNRGELVDALIRHRWIDRGRGKSLTIHGWLERNKRVLEYRLSQSEKANKRWEEHKRRHKLLQSNDVDEYAPDAQAMPPHMPKQSTGNASYPPTLPTKPSTPSNPTAETGGGGGEKKASKGEEAEVARLAVLFRDTFGRSPRPAEEQQLRGASARLRCGSEVWEYAFHEAARNAARGLSYVLTVAQKQAASKDVSPCESNPHERRATGATLSSQFTAALAKSDLSDAQVREIKDRGMGRAEIQRFLDSGDAQALWESFTQRQQPREGEE